MKKNMLFIKRLILFIVAVAVIVLSIAMSGLNTEKVVLNLYYLQFDLSLGFLLILTLFFGLLIGLLMALFQFYMPLTSKIRQLERKNRTVSRELMDQKRIVHSND